MWEELGTVTGLEGRDYFEGMSIGDGRAFEGICLEGTDGHW